MKIKLTNLLIILISLNLYSCGNKIKEFTPASNENNLKVKLEVKKESSKNDKFAAFSLRFTNSGDRDFARCVIKLNGKYEHSLGGLYFESDDGVGHLNTSLLAGGEDVNLVFNDETDNFSNFGVKEDMLKNLETVELECLDGKVIWKIEN